MTYGRIEVIINPMAGQDTPVLGALARSFGPAGIEWNVSITKRSGDARKQAEAALEAGVDVVAVHGGDGTVGEVAGALVDTDVPLAILPGGTANILATELAIPGELMQACALITTAQPATRLIDVGEADGRYFFVRAGMGIEAAMVEGADRAVRDRFGPLSYVVAGLRALGDPVLSRYRLVLDGREIEQEGITCVVNNAGALGPGGLRIAPQIDISDGLLDVVVLSRPDIPSLLAVAARIVIRAEPLEPLYHWQAREVSVVAEPAQMVQIDGEVIGESTLRTRLLPQALRVVVPAGSLPV